MFRPWGEVAPLSHSTVLPLSGSDSPRRAADVWWFLLSIIAGLALLLRAVTVRESLWVDELHTAWCVEGPFGDVASRARAGNQPPMYFWMLWFVTRVLGYSEISLRLPSLLAGIASLVLCAIAVRRWTGSGWLGLLTGLCVAGDPQAIDFAREARPYAFVQSLSLVHVGLLLRLQRDRRWPIRLAWIGLAWTMFYCHYTTAVLLLGEMAYLVVSGLRRPRPERRVVIDWVLDFALCGVGMLAAWLPLVEIAGRRQNWARFVPRSDASQIVRLFAGEVYVLQTAVLAIVLAIVVYGRGQRWSPRRLVVGRLILCGCWYLVPVVAAWILTYQDWARLFFRRYLIVVGLVPMIIGGVLGGLLPRDKTRVTYAGLAFLLVLISWSGGRPWSSESPWRTHRRENWRAAVGWVNSLSADRALPVYLRPGLIEDDALRQRDDRSLREYCRFPLHGLYRLDQEPPSWTILPSTASWQWTERQRQPLQQHGAAWLILRQHPSRVGETVSRLVDALRLAGIPVSVAQQRQFGNVTVLRLQVSSTSAASTGAKRR